MITLKANEKMNDLFWNNQGLTKENIEALATLVAAPNILVKDITSKGEVIIEDINETLV